MRSLSNVLLYILLIPAGYGQNVFRAIIVDDVSGDPLPGATAVIKKIELGAVANQEGMIKILNIPDGSHTLEFSYVGFETHLLSFDFPLSDSLLEVRLSPSSEELDEIVISSTRSSRTIADIPTRVEFIAGEELEEKGNMKPGDIRMLLNESTGIQTQQTSATSANASIRIQGLDGRYTQILKDGFPLYAGFSGGLGLLQTPPLDLKQVEVIKGSSSTLYGGGAIAGMVNLISKVPADERELRFWVNGTSAGGLDVNGFYGEDLGLIGTTIFLSRNSHAPYDPASIDLTAIPKYERYTVNPKLFFDMGDRSELTVGANFTTEDRIGGDLHFINGNGDGTHHYFEQNDSERLSTQVSFTHSWSGATQLNFKNSLNWFERVLATPGYVFDGSQSASFTELHLAHTRDKTEWIVGVNAWTDKFAENPATTVAARDYQQTTVGVFVQNNWQLADAWQVESGLRGDYVNDYEFVLLPRASLLYKPVQHFSSRIGGGFGYKTPTIFTEESERLQFQNVLPVSSSINQLEKSYGANWDFTYKASLVGGAAGLSVNHLFYYTYLANPLMLTSTTGGFQLMNIAGHILTQGTETNVTLEIDDFKLFLGYTFTDTKIHEGTTSRRNPLTPRHRLNNVLMYEVEEKWKIGLEAYYFSEQQRSNDTVGRDYWICGLMMERIWGKISLYMNFENFLDTRQTRFENIYTGTVSNPVFRDIYAPVDGFVVNGGFKIRI